MRVWRWPWCDSDCANFQMSKKPVYWLRGIVARERRFRRYDLAYMDAALSIPHTPPTGAWTSLTERNGFALFAPLPTLLRAYSRDQAYIKVSWVGEAMRLQNMRLSDICSPRIYPTYAKYADDAHRQMYPQCGFRIANPSPEPPRPSWKRHLGRLQLSKAVGKCQKCLTIEKAPISNDWTTSFTVPNAFIWNSRKANIAWISHMKIAAFNFTPYKESHALIVT